MSGKDKSSRDEDRYKVGYKRPPKAGQFKPGRSGNIKGRPRKAKQGVLDMATILDNPVEVSQGGRTVEMEPRKIALLAQVKKAQSGDRNALVYVVEQFLKHGVIGAPQQPVTSGVMTLPNTMPFAMAQQMAQRFGHPPWTAKQIKAGREGYVARRSEAEAQRDQAIGYPDL